MHVQPPRDRSFSGAPLPSIKAVRFAKGKESESCICSEGKRKFHFESLRFLVERRLRRRAEIKLLMIFTDCSSSTTARLLPLSRQHGVVTLRRLLVCPLNVGPPSRSFPRIRTLTFHSSTSPSPVLAGTSPHPFPLVSVWLPGKCRKPYKCRFFKTYTACVLLILLT